MRAEAARRTPHPRASCFTLRPAPRARVGGRATRHAPAPQVPPRRPTDLSSVADHAACLVVLSASMTQDAAMTEGRNLIMEYSCCVRSQKYCASFCVVASVLAAFTKRLTNLQEVGTVSSKPRVLRMSDSIWRGRVGVRG